MRLSILAFVLLAILPSGLESQASPQPPTVAEVEELLRVMEMEAQHDSARVMMLDEFRRNPMTAQMATIFEDIMREHVTYAKVKPDIIAVYLKVFTGEEVRALTAFHATPVGRSIAMKQMTVGREMMRLTSDRLQAQMPEILRRMQEGNRP